MGVIATIQDVLRSIKNCVYYSHVGDSLWTTSKFMDPENLVMLSTMTFARKKYP